MGVAELDAVNTDLIPEASEPDFDRDEDVAERLSAGEALSGEAGAQNSDRTQNLDNDNAVTIAVLGVSDRVRPLM